MDVPNDMVLPVLVNLAYSFGDEENEIPEFLFGKSAFVYRAGLEFLLQGLGIDTLVVTDEDA